MIRFAEEKDINNIMTFIDTYWKKGHILGTNEEFFRYEHLLDEGVTYAIAENDDDGRIDAILGYIPYGKKHRDIMTVMWKANHTADPSLGLNLFKFLRDEADVRIMASPGSNPKLRGLYNYLGYQFGKMTQWYRLGRAEDYKVVKLSDDTIPESKAAGREWKIYGEWEELKEDFDFDSYVRSEVKPVKEEWYIKKRYFDHPIYKYMCLGLVNDLRKVDTLIFFRKIDVNGSSVLRFIDCIGDFNAIRYSADAIDFLLEKCNAECIDCYETGVNDQCFIDAGWRKTAETRNIIPHYFAPFVQENIDIFYFSSDPKTVLFKGDGDQDRPN